MASTASNKGDGQGSVLRDNSTTGARKRSGETTMSRYRALKSARDESLAVSPEESIATRHLAVESARAALMIYRGGGEFPEDLLPLLLTLGRSLIDVDRPARNPAHWTGRLGELSEKILKLTLQAVRLGVRPDQLPHTLQCAMILAEESVNTAEQKRQRARALIVEQLRQALNRIHAMPKIKIADVLGRIDRYVRTIVPPPRLQINTESATVVLDGETFSNLDSNAVRMLKAISEARGAITLEEVCEMVYGNHHVRSARRCLDRMPKVIRDCIVGVRGRGMTIVLPSECH